MVKTVLLIQDIAGQLWSYWESQVKIGCCTGLSSPVALLMILPSEVQFFLLAERHCFMAPFLFGSNENRRNSGKSNQITTYRAIFYVGRYIGSVCFFFSEGPRQGGVGPGRPPWERRIFFFRNALGQPNFVGSPPAPRLGGWGNPRGLKKMPDWDVYL